ncbi:ATP-binding protein (plasmid) [Halorientalis pallida]|uniref:ATP-binding protein n=1 Tax=Halorientalis pallida TaxID=2479928 RepID=UPI003C6FF5C9
MSGPDPRRRRERQRNSEVPDPMTPLPTITAEQLQETLAEQRKADASESATTAETATQRPTERDTEGEATENSESNPTSDPDSGDDPGGRDDGDAQSNADAGDDTSQPYIKITPAREQVPPRQIVKGLFGFHRAGQGSSLPLAGTIPYTSPQRTFEFLIHKPRDTQRFDFYIGVHPYDVRAFKNLANNISAMYPDSFTFEVVSFAVRDAFTRQSNYEAGLEALAELEGIEEIEGLQGFQQITTVVDELADDGDVEIEGDEPEFEYPSMVQWAGTEANKNDWMTLLSRFSELEATTEEGYRSPLSVLLEQAAGTDDPFVFQAVFTPRADWTNKAEKHKRNLKMGVNGAGSAFKQELVRQLFGTSDDERRQIHRGETPEQIGGTINSGEPGNSHQLPRMGQIDLKQPTVTFDLSLRAAGPETVIGSVAGAFSPLSGPYYGIEGNTLGQSKRAFKRLCEATITYPGMADRLRDDSPLLIASPDELANFVTVPNHGSLPKVSRGASGGTPDVRSPLTATDETQLAKYNHGMCIGSAVTASPDREDIDIRLSAEQLTHHVLRAASTGAGKSTAMVNDALSAYGELDGPIFIFDKKGGSMFDEYKRAHFREFGNLDDIVHFTVPGGNGEVPAFPFFDIRPQVAAGMSREAAVQEKMDRYVELLSYVIGAEMNENAFVANEILANLIKALFDPAFGRDAYGISDLLEAAIRMQEEREIPEVSDPEIEAALTRHFSADERRFETSIDAVINRITKLQERDFIWRMMNFVPEWDDEDEAYAEDQMFFNLDDILDSKRVILIDTGELRPASSNLFTVLMLDYLWSWVRLRKRMDRELPSPSDGYVVNLVIDEAAPIMQAALLRDEMIPDAREFALAFELILHFPEQVKRDALDTSAYKEILRNINTKLIGKGANDDELATTLFHEELDAEELADRIASLPRGEWIAQLPDTGFMTDTPELVSMVPLSIPKGHSDGGEPVTSVSGAPNSQLTFSEMDLQQRAFTRHRYCLIPSVNSPPTVAQRAARFGAGVMGSNVAEDAEPSQSVGESSQNGSEADSDDDENSKSGGPSGEEPSNNGAWTNDYGTTLGTSGDGPVNPTRESNAAAKSDAKSETPRSQTNSSPAGQSNPVANGEPEPSTNGTSEPDKRDGHEPPADLTDDEVRFLRNVVKALNGELEGYELTQSMTIIRNLSGGDIDEDKLEEKGYLEPHWAGQRYYWIPKKGQEAVNRSLYTGRNRGDFNEKTIHKVFSEYFARYVEHEKGLHVEKYYEPPGGGMIFDVAGFTIGEDGWEDLTVIGEILTQVNPAWAVKHYEDFREFDGVEKYWVVQNYEVAHDLVRALQSAGYIAEIPSKDITDYEEITDEAFGSDSDWKIVGANEIVESVKEFEADEEES